MSSQSDGFGVGPKNSLGAGLRELDRNTPASSLAEDYMLARAKLPLSEGSPDPSVVSALRMADHIINTAPRASSSGSFQRFIIRARHATWMRTDHGIEVRVHVEKDTAGFNPRPMFVADGMHMLDTARLDGAGHITFDMHLEDQQVHRDEGPAVTISGATFTCTDGCGLYAIEGVVIGMGLTEPDNFAHMLMKHKLRRAQRD